MNWKKKRERRGARGSATIELSILMPMLCVLILLLLYLGLYLYNRTVLYGDAYLAAYQGTFDAGAANEEAYRIAENELQERMEHQLVALDAIQTEVTVTYEEVAVSYEGSMAVPIAADNPFFDRWNLFAISGEVSAKRHRPVTFIRQCRKLEQLLETNEEGEGYGDGSGAESE